MFLDALDKACPMPVVMAKKKMDENVPEITIAVDNETAVENLKKLATTEAYEAEVKKEGENFHVIMTKSDSATNKKAGGEATKCMPMSIDNGYAVFFKSEFLGSGSDELGQRLAKMAIYTLAESDNLPKYILCMNGGVKLCTNEDQQTIESLKKLIDNGVELLVCGACLDFFEVKDKLKAGKVSNMYDILGAMKEVSKVIEL